MDLCAGDLVYEADLRARRRERAQMQAGQAAEQSAVLSAMRPNIQRHRTCVLVPLPPRLDDVRCALRALRRRLRRHY